MRVCSRNALSKPYISHIEMPCSASMLVMLKRQLSWTMRSMIASAKELASPPSCSYHSSNFYWEQKIVEDFLRLQWSSSKISLCSKSVGLNRSHSSRIRTTGLVYLAMTFLQLRHHQVNKQIRKANIPDIEILLTSLHTKGTCHINFTTACCADNEKIPVFRYIFASGKPTNQFLVQLATGSIVNILRLLYSTSTSIPN